MPFLPLIYAELRKLPKEIEWEWWVMEGIAWPVHCTRWVKGVNGRLSNDGTTGYLKSLSRFDSRVRHHQRTIWEGKIEMVNLPLFNAVNRPQDWGATFLLWQIDSDEVWTAQQIIDCWMMFQAKPEKNAAFFWCRYFVGPDKVITTRNCFGNHPEYEWHRVWKITPGMLFKTHEPPVIDGLKLNPFTHAETEARGLVFDHFSYATRAQVEWKERYYAGPNNPTAAAYKGLTERWKKFQNEKEWPRSLKEVMPWAESHCMVNTI